MKWLTSASDFLIPMPMFFSHYTFSKGFFVGWVIITFIWVLSSTAISVVMPILETAGFFKTLCREIMADISGKRKRVRKAEVIEAKAPLEETVTPGSVTPEKEREARA